MRSIRLLVSLAIAVAPALAGAAEDATTTTTTAATAAPATTPSPQPVTTPTEPVATQVTAAEPAVTQPATPPKAQPRPSGLAEDLTVTVTRTPRPTRDVPQAVTVISKDRLADSVTFNIMDVISGTPGVLAGSKNGGYDARLLIRGAGLKAAYGVREIMVLRDGVPLTDPDSLTRLDFVDMQDIERIEITKGPGSLYSPGSAGGAIQIISRSVFDSTADEARAGLGTQGSGNLHLRVSRDLGGAGMLALTTSFRTQDNSWRAWNQFDTKQVSLKHGLMLDQSSLETEVAYTEANIQLPGGASQALFDAFLKTGKQDSTSEPWRNSGRYSKIVFANAKLEHPMGGLRLKPRVYYTQWSHLHPVTGAINDTAAWTHVGGTDLEAQHEHDLGPIAGTLAFGVTAKRQWNDDTRKYQYRDVTLANGRIVGTLSDAEGPELERSQQWNTLYGAFAGESLRIFDRVIVDVGMRFDRGQVHVDQQIQGAYDWAQGAYVSAPAHVVTDRSFDLPAPKVGVTLRVLDEVSLYGTWARANQVPAESELTANPKLDPARSTNLEAGFKVRSRWLNADLAVYQNQVTSEIVARLVNGTTVYDNAGETKKRGLEASAGVRPLDGLELGAGYAYSDFTYVSYFEKVGRTEADRSGNRLPYVPRHQWSAYAAWTGPWGLRARFTTTAWGSYYLDAANSARYKGYAWLNSLGIGWRTGPSDLLLDVENAADQRYAMQVTKDTSGKVVYTPGAPRSFMLSYRHELGGRP